MGVAARQTSDEIQRLQSAILEGIGGIDVRLRDELRRLDKDIASSIGDIRERLIVLERVRTDDIERVREQVADLREDVRSLKTEVRAMSERLYLWTGGIAVLAVVIPLVIRYLT